MILTCEPRLYLGGGEPGLEGSIWVKCELLMYFGKLKKFLAYIISIFQIHQKLFINEIQI